MRAIVFALLAAGCGSGVQGPLASPDTSQMNPMKPMQAMPAPLHDHGDNPNPVLFESDAHPYGADMVTWGERASQWIWGTPADHNPLLDQTGADCGVGQQGPVWFIAPIAGPRVFTGTRTCTIPPQRALLLDIGEDV